MITSLNFLSRENVKYYQFLGQNQISGCKCNHFSCNLEHWDGFAKEFHLHKTTYIHIHCNGIQNTKNLKMGTETKFKIDKKQNV